MRATPRIEFLYVAWVEGDFNAGIVYFLRIRRSISIVVLGVYLPWIMYLVQSERNDCIFRICVATIG